MDKFVPHDVPPAMVGFMPACTDWFVSPFLIFLAALMNIGLMGSINIWVSWI